MTTHQLKHRLSELVSETHKAETKQEPKDL